MKLSYQVIFTLLALGLSGTMKAGPLQQQGFQLQGTVISESGQPLENVTIAVGNSGSATTTDKQGNFLLSSVAKGMYIIFTYVGYKTERLEVASSSYVHVTMQLQSNELKEVAVSTGYQVLPRERQTGSYDFIDQKTLSQQVSPNVIGRLEAIANGLSVDRSTNTAGRIMIRGLSTINGPKEPLIVLDNFPYSGNINNINPNEVESITVLKDAAATSIWGTKAGNGVIVITTKKGRFNRPVSVDFNSNITVVSKPDLFYPDQISPADFVEVEKMLFAKGFYKSQLNSSSKPVLTPVVELLNQKAAGKISAAEADARIEEMKTYDSRDQFSRLVYNKGLNQQYAVAVRGGSNTTAWSISSGYDRTRNELSAIYDRLNVNAQNSFKFGKKFGLTSGLLITQGKTESGKAGYGEITSKSNIYLYPYARFADDNGNALVVNKDYRQSYKELPANSSLLDWNYYPLNEYKNIENKTSVLDLVANAVLQYKISDPFSVDIKYQYERQQTNGRNLRNENSYSARNLVNQYTQIDQGSGTVTNKVPVGGVLDMSNSLLQANNFRGQFNFEKKWVNNQVTAIAGVEVRNVITEGNSNRFYGYRDDILTYGNVDYTTRYPSYINGNTSLIPNSSGISSILTRYISQYVNAAYSFKERYTFSLSGRRDASNLFGLHANDKWNPLWSAGLSWDVSQESFYKLSFLPFFKLRATYGLSGNTDPALTAVTTIAYVTLSPYTQSSYARFSNYYNPELKWESSRILNLGIDFGFINQRVTGSVEFYKKKGSDLFGTALVDYTTGVGATLYKNVAGMKGKGWDIELNSLNINSGFKWNSQLVMNFYSDRITDYYLNSLPGSEYINYKTTVSGVPGKPVYSIFSYKSAGLDGTSGDPQGYIDGSVSKDYFALTSVPVEELVYNGPALPTAYGSLGNTFSFKGVSLTVRMLYKFGYYYRKQSILYGDLFSNFTGHSDFEKRWQKPGDELRTNVPSMVYPNDLFRDYFYSGTESLVEKGDHIRLQYISASYDLPTVQWKSSPLRSMQIYSSISNLGIIWRANKSHIDPDYYFSGNTLLPSRTIAFGVKATF